jgi:lipopolysaccharide transport system ATP-binding protein
MTDIAIHAEHLSKRFMVQSERRMGLKERFVRGRAPRGREFWALRDATFDVPRGSMFGIVGHNGSGKSTALKVIAGIYRPTSGSVTVNGKLSALLELGAGFHPELTGRENIALNGSILGMTKRQIAEQTDEIVDFSGLSDFIDAPVKTYSSGMYVRLGFAIAVKVDPEILVIDEVIAVGDEDFQRRCFDYIAHLRSRGSTIVIVTHSMGIVTDRCDYAMWLDHGEVQALGKAREVVDGYLDRVNQQESARTQGAGQSDDPVGIVRRGTGEVRVLGYEVLDESGQPAAFLVANRPGTVRMHYRAARDIDDCVFGLGFFTESDINVTGPNSQRSGGRDVTSGFGYIDFHMPNVLLAPDTYKLSTAVVRRGDFIDMLDRAFLIKVRGASTGEPGLFTTPGSWSELIAATENTSSADSVNRLTDTTVGVDSNAHIG